MTFLEIQTDVEIEPRVNPKCLILNDICRGAYLKRAALIVTKGLFISFQLQPKSLLPSHQRKLNCQAARVRNSLRYLWAYLPLHIIFTSNQSFGASLLCLDSTS